MRQCPEIPTRLFLYLSDVAAVVTCFVTLLFFYVHSGSSIDKASHREVFLSRGKNTA